MHSLQHKSLDIVGEPTQTATSTFPPQVIKTDTTLAGIVADNSPEVVLIPNQ